MRPEITFRPPSRTAPARRRTSVLLVLAVVAAFSAVQLLRPLPTVEAQGAGPAVSQIRGETPDIPWPERGQAAMEVLGLGPLGTSGDQEPVPIASVAKVMTAVVVLDDHPLEVDEEGPSITVTRQDVRAFESAGELESLARVEVGAKLSQRDALEALLVGSANNIAPMLARWVAGSEEAFVASMNTKAKSLGLRDTRYADSIGLDADTVSTAVDQVRLARVAMRDPVFREIVGLLETEVPVAGRLFNYNTLIGKDRIVGIKTGSTLAAGGNFVFAALETIDDETETVIGAVLGQRNLRSALTQGQRLVRAAKEAIEGHTILRKGTTVATVPAPWSSDVRAAVTETVTSVGWPGLRVAASVRREEVDVPVRKGSRVGTLVVRVGSRDVGVPIVATDDIPAPGTWWRLTRI